MMQVLELPARYCRWVREIAPDEEFDVGLLRGVHEIFALSVLIGGILHEDRWILQSETC
jgi:hypothetical protein